MLPSSAPGPAGTPTGPTLVQLTSPVRGGVRDYLDGLGRSWLEAGVASEVIELTQADAGRLPLHTRLAALRRGDNGELCVVLHYSGYGFDKRGLCGWLATEIERTRVHFGRRLRVVTMFHELFASGGPPWRSAFWLSGVQASIAERIVQRSDAIWTNSGHHARWLRAQAGPARPLHVRPVFSTVGEPQRVPGMADRRRRVVVFGAAPTRARALRRLPLFMAVLQRAGVTELVEAGSGAACGLQADGLGYRHVGALEPAALRALLQDSMYALIDYPSVHLAKSSVFASYAAHGCVVLNTAPDGPDADGLRAGRHFHTLARPDTGWQHDPQALSDAARRWYARHPLRVQAAEFLRLCGLAASVHGVSSTDPDTSDELTRLPTPQTTQIDTPAASDLLRS